MIIHCIVFYFFSLNTLYIKDLSTIFFLSFESTIHFCLFLEIFNLCFRLLPPFYRLYSQIIYLLFSFTNYDFYSFSFTFNFHRLFPFFLPFFPFLYLTFFPVLLFFCHLLYHFVVVFFLFDLL